MKQLRHAVRWMLACLLRLTGGIWWAKRRLRHRRGVVVLMLHRVLSDSEIASSNSLPGMIIRLNTFRSLVSYCANHYRVVALPHRDPQIASKPRVAFTFDDGWADTYVNAFPITQQQNVPVTVFICPGLVDQISPFWPERVIASLKLQQRRQEEIEATVEGLKTAPAALIDTLDSLELRSEVDRTMSWPEILKMHEAGAGIGSHTQTHQLLTTVSEKTARREVANSRQALETNLHDECVLFAYPNGNYSLATRKMLMDTGYELAFTTKRGAWTRGCDRLAIPRANICEDNVVSWTGRFSPALFEYSVFWNAWRATRI